jgi:hypothetical protein
MVLVNWLKENYKGILVGAIAVGLIAGIAWPKREAKLQDGQEVAAETSVKKYTAEFLYESLKEKNGLTVLLQNIDKDIIKEKYGSSLDAEAKESATTEAENYINQYKLYYQMDEETFLAKNGFKTKDEFIESLVVSYKLDYYVTEYISKNLTDEELKSYYDSNVFGDKKITLISSTTNEADVKKAQKELKSGTSLDKVKSKYKDLVYNDLLVTFDISSSFAEVITNTIKNMDSKTVSEVLKDDTYGNLAIYVSSSKDKPAYESVVDSIKKSIAQTKQSEDDTLYYKAMIELRNEYGIKFYDSKYEEYYKNFNKQYAGQ